MNPVEIRLRHKVSKEEMEEKVGKILTPGDHNIRLTGPARVLMPNGQPLCVYLPGIIPEEQRVYSYPILHEIRSVTDNRGLAGGAPRVKVGKQTRGLPVMSSVIGYFDAAGSGARYPFCRTTAWTGEHADEFKELFPLFRTIGDLLRQYVPDRWSVQNAHAEQTQPEFRISDTPFTTVTVNNTFPTGVHKDAGDLHEGYSCLMVLRRGEYKGGILTFPEWRIGVDFQDGDVLLMDAHEWHGNTDIALYSEDAERISLVLYYRTEMIACGTPEEELERAKEKSLGNNVLAGRAG